MIVATRRRAVDAVLAGKGGYDDLTADEQAVVRTAWQERVDDLVERVDVGQQRLNDGKTYLALDEGGALIRHHPDGTVETL